MTWIFSPEFEKTTGQMSVCTNPPDKSHLCTIFAYPQNLITAIAMLLKLTVALFLLAGAIKIAAPWTSFVENQNIFFSSEENNKGNDSDSKKQIEEQTFNEPGFLIANNTSRLVKHASYYHPFIPTHHDEPSSPPPNSARS